MYGSHQKFNQFISTINFTGVTLINLFVVVCVFELCRSGAENIGQGKYLRFTFRLANNNFFKILSWLLVIFIVMLIVDTIKFLVFLYVGGWSGYLLNFAEFLLPTLLTLGFSAYSLGSAKADPFFNYETDEFANLQFSRGWMEVATDNNAFAKQLGIALLFQKRGDDKDLKAKFLEDWMTPACSSPTEVEKACDIPSEKDALM